MTQGALAIALSLFLLGAAQQQQQPQAPSIPDAPAPSGLSDLKGQVTPGSGTTPDSKQGDQTAPPSQPPAQQQAAPSAADQVQQEPPETPKAGQTESFLIHVPVNFIDVPVTVRDKKGNLVFGLTYRQFRIYEDGGRQRLAFFSVDPLPLSVAFVIDQSLPSDVMKKVNRSLSALTGAFSPADTVAVFTYDTSPQMVTDFTASQGPRLPAGAGEGEDERAAIWACRSATGPMATGTMINGQTPDPNLGPQRGNALAS